MPWTARCFYWKIEKNLLATNYIFQSLYKRSRSFDQCTGKPSSMLPLQLVKSILSVVLYNHHYVRRWRYISLTVWHSLIVRWKSWHHDDWIWIELHQEKPSTAIDRPWCQLAACSDNLGATVFWVSIENFNKVPRTVGRSVFKTKW